MGWARFDQMLQRLKSKDSQWPSRLNSWHFELIGFHKFASRCLETFGMNIEHPVMLVPAHRHYCWQKAAALFGFGDETMKIVHLDEQGRLDVAHLRQRLLSARQSHHPVMMVVSVAGTTEMGAMDPVADVSATCKSIGVIWHHLDAAYGGFFASLRDVEAAENSHGMSDDFLGGVRSFCLADSITIDPHKLGYVPYAAGVFLLRDGRDYDLHSIDAPYIQYDAADRGPVTIEGSRPATGAAATWMLAKTMPLNAGGFGRILLRHFMARRVLEDALCASTLPIRVVKTSESNVLCFVVAAEGESLSVVNQRSHELYRALSGPDARFFVSKTTIFWQNASALCERFSGSWGAQCDTGSIVLLRMCLMNPFFTSSETLVAYSREFVREIEFILRGT
jgi:glutamate/tyrosine decarboxylase-like PLP-dependent enzyme